MNKKLLFLLAASQLAYAGPVFAQEAQAVGASADDNAIIVTARRRDESLTDVPISITAISGETLEARGIVDGISLAQNVPSLNLTSAGALKSNVAFSIRGQRTGETQILTDPPVGLYFAEVNQPRTVGLTASFFDLQNIQVLKGVQGTLFGRNMTGGAVLIEPAHPSDKFEGYVRAGYGNYNAWNTEAMINLPLGEAAALRVSGRLNRRDGYVTDLTTGRDYMDDHSDAVRVSLKLTPGTIENLTIFDYLQTDENGTAIVGDFYKVGGATGAFGLINAAYSGAFGGTPNTAGNQIPNNPAAFGAFAGRRVFLPVSNIPAQIANQAAIRNSSNPYRFNSSGIGLRGTYDLVPQGGGVLPFERIKNWGITNKTIIPLGDDLSVKNVFGYRKIEFSALTDLDGIPAPLINSSQFRNVDMISEELQLSGKAMDGKLDFVTGLYYFREKGEDGNRGTQFPELTAAFDPRPGALSSNNLVSAGLGSGVATSYAVYGGFTYALADTVKFSGGLRYTNDKREVTNRRLGTDGLPPVGTNGFLNACTFNITPVAGVPNPPRAAAPDCSVQTEQSWNALTYDATLAYQPDVNTNLYASFRKGFRAGAFSLRAGNYLELVPADPETVYEYETGFKNTSNIGGGRLTTSVALFYQDYRNVQKQVPFISGTVVGTQILNIARQSIKGGELEFALKVSRMDFGLGYSLTDITVKEIAPSIADQYGDTGVPKHQVNGNIGWHLPIPEELGDLQVGASISFKSRIRLGANTASGVGATQPAYELIDLRLQWNEIGGSNFDVGAFVKNVGNTFYRNGVIDIVSTTGIGGSIYGAPRTYGLTVGVNF